MTIPFRVHIMREMEEEQKRYLEDQLGEEVSWTYGESIPEQADYQVLVGGRPTAGLVEASSALQALIIPWAGVPGSTRTLMEQYPAVSVHNLHHNAVPTAELAFTLLLSVAKQVLPFDAALRENDWQLRYEPSQTWLMKGKTALILGYGEIGSRVGRYLDALGMRVRATRKHPPDPPTGSVEVYSAGQLEALLPEADVLVVTLPLTPETRGLVGEKELAQLPAGAILVNVARGPVVDQGALYSALKTGQLFGAGLDVWYHYPHAEEERSDTSPADDPFHELPNVVMSPHRGGSTRETEQLRMEYLAALLQAAAEGRSIPNRVDFDRGY